MSTNELQPVKIQISGVAYGLGQDGVKPPTPKPTTEPEKNDGEVNDAR